MLQGSFHVLQQGKDLSLFEMEVRFGISQYSVKISDILHKEGKGKCLKDN